MDTSFVILTIPLVYKSLACHLYRIHNLPLLHPTLPTSFQYEIEHRFFEINSDLSFITFPDNENVLNCIVSSGHF